jgi:hypothetical protein
MEPQNRRKPVEPRLPSPQIPRPVPELSYSRPIAGEYHAPLPFVAGFAIGFAIYLVCCAGAWAILRFGDADGGGIMCMLVGVPLAATFIAGILQTRFEWRGAVAGTCAAFALSILLGCFGLALLCRVRW